MKNGTRVFWVLSLVFFLVGCTTYRPGYVPGEPQGVQAGAEDGPVRVGSTVRITLKDGNSVSGKVTALSNEELVLGGRGNYGFEDLTINVKDIENVEIRNESDSTIELGWFVAITVLLVGGVIYAYSQLGNLR